MERTDSLRPREVGRVERRHRPSRTMGSVVPGYLSRRGLPPRPGQVIVTDTVLIFRSADGRTVETYPLVGPVRTVEGRTRRARAVSLAYMVEEGARPVYVFRLDGGVFSTDGPGSLLHMAERPEWLDTLASREWGADRTLAPAGDTAASEAITRRIGSSGYADTLYALFGRPARPIGMVGARGRKAGRLGEYLARRDSLALDPARIISEDQLRHALAHELAHRWQSRAPAQLAVLWQGVPAIRDPKRYGHNSVAEHQAEAVAFAVHFLQATTMTPGADAAALLEQYERLVPGTRLVARYLALQPIYAGHPLRGRLTSDRLLS
jgi:hypothetical protein